MKIFMINITAPFTEEVIKSLKAGDCVLLSGEIYTGRDAAHKRMIELLDSGKPLPFDFDSDSNSQAIYYTGPCPAPHGKIVGSCGPTTSLRMDRYSPKLIQEGLRVMIGKGERNHEVAAAIREYNGVYLSAVGGAGALLSFCVKKSELVAFPDLGTEAVYKFTVEDMPLAVAIDCHGGNIFERR